MIITATTLTRTITTTKTRITGETIKEIEMEINKETFKSNFTHLVAPHHIFHHQTISNGMLIFLENYEPTLHHLRK